MALDASAGRLASRYEALSEATIRGDVNHIAFSFPKHFLGLPVHGTLKATTRDAESRLISTAPSTNLADSISQTIRSRLCMGIPTIEEAADFGNMSIRTLQRRLSDKGMAYHELVDRARFHEAIPMLEDPQVKLSEIADYLGYSDAANFTRAFRRWTATTPSQFRRRMRTEGTGIHQR